LITLLSIKGGGDGNHARLFDAVGDQRDQEDGDEEARRDERGSAAHEVEAAAAVECSRWSSQQSRLPLSLAVQYEKAQQEMASILFVSTIFSVVTMGAFMWLTP
jgi:hypothetical protein